MLYMDLNLFDIPVAARIMLTFLSCNRTPVTRVSSQVCKPNCSKKHMIFIADTLTSWTRDMSANAFKLCQQNRLMQVSVRLVTISPELVTGPLNSFSKSPAPETSFFSKGQ